MGRKNRHFLAKFNTVLLLITVICYLGLNCYSSIIQNISSIIIGVCLGIFLFVNFNSRHSIIKKLNYKKISGRV
jgi:hypothetical protein